MCCLFCEMTQKHTSTGAALDCSPNYGKHMQETAAFGGTLLRHDGRPPSLSNGNLFLCILMAIVPKHSTTLPRTWKVLGAKGPLYSALLWHTWQMPTNKKGENFLKNIFKNAKLDLITWKSFVEYHLLLLSGRSSLKGISQGKHFPTHF